MSGSHEKPDLNQEKVQLFLKLHAANQHRIYGFIMSFLADWNEADDVYQETLSVLWRRFDEYVPGTNFPSWAFKVAHFQVLSHMRTQKTQKKHFSQATIENLSEVVGSSSQEQGMMIEALRKCITGMSEQGRELLSMRYEDGATIKSISQRLQRSINTLYKEYQKIHVHLFNCIRKRMGWDSRLLEK